MEKTIGQEIRLICIGALISFVSAFVTDCRNSENENRRNNTQKKLELNEQISKDLSKRLFWTYEMYKNRRDNKDSLFRISFNQYQLCREDWNLKIFPYMSLLEFYYGVDQSNDFVEKAYNPLVALGQNVVNLDTVLFKDYSTRYISVRKDIKSFIVDAYKNAQ